MAKFLVLQAARFGDLAQTKRLILSLRAQGRVHIGVDQGLAKLASILYPDANIHSLRIHGAPNGHGLRLDREIFQQWRQMDFDEIHNCNLSPLTSEICRLFPPERVIGNRPAHDFTGGVLRSPWCRLAGRLAAKRAASPLNLVDYWGWFAKNPIAPQNVNPPAKGKGGGLGIALAGRDPRRSLPVPVLAAIAKTVFRLMDGPQTYLLGGKNEIPAARRLARFLEKPMLEKTRDLSGKTDWPDLCEIVSSLDLLLTPDTGLMHLAAHFGAPVMAFFLSSAWCHETGPYGIGHTIWQSEIDCGPCIEKQPCARAVACLRPFAEPSFARLLAFALEKRNFSNLDFPPGLQCWQTDLDDLGAFCSMKAGRDENAAQRSAARALLRRWLKIEPPQAMPQNGQTARMAEFLFPDGEWMLPPWRYC